MPVCRAFHSLVGTVSQTLTPGLYEFLANMQTTHADDAADAKGKSCAAAKVKREGRHVPNLVRASPSLSLSLTHAGQCSCCRCIHVATRLLFGAECHPLVSPHAWGSCSGVLSQSMPARFRVL